MKYLKHLISCININKSDYGAAIRTAGAFLIGNSVLIAVLGTASWWRPVTLVAFGVIFVTLGSVEPQEEEK